MKSLRFDRTTLYIDGQPGWLMSGEFHYFRVPRQDWAHRMKLLRDAGGNALATYIPWLIHEPVEGQFRLDADDGVSDLSRFLDCAADAGLAVIARPGPYQYSELNYAGLPAWLGRDYPQVLARNRRGEVINYFSVSYSHPLFLEKVTRYFDRICPILAAYSITRGGPVALVQPDNEIGGIHAWFGDLDFNAETMGFGREDGAYARFLARRWGSVERANAAYGTHHATFAAFSPADEPGQGSARLRWSRDYFDFYCGTLADYLATLVDLMTERGIDTAFVHNAANPGMNSWLRETKARLGDRILIGSDHYYNLNQNWAQNSPTPQYAIQCYLSTEMLRIMGNPATVLEFPFGSLADWPPVTATDLNAAARLHTAFGWRGMNGYIFTGGPNVPGTGGTGDIYDYGAPVGAQNEVRDHYYALQRFGLFMQAHPELASDVNAADFRIVMPWDALRAGDNWGMPDDPRAMKPADLWTDLRTGVTSSAFAAGLTPTLIEATDEEAWRDRSSPVVVMCDGVMARELQQRVIDFLEAGGRVLCLPMLPFLDEALYPCTLLSDYLDHAAAGAPRSGNLGAVELTIAGVNNVWLNGNWYPAVTMPADAAVIGRDHLSQTIMAWQKSCGQAGGIFAWLGLRWFHGKQEQAQMLENLLTGLGMERRHRVNNPWVISLLRRDAAGWKLHAANLSTGPQTIQAAWRPEAVPNAAWRPAGRHELAPMEVKIIELS